MMRGPGESAISRDTVSLRVLVCLAAIAAVMALAPPVPANAEYQTDPLGLIEGYDATTHYSLGEDHWEVWICDSPDGDIAVSASGVAALLESELAPYFNWLSSGRYQPIFKAGDPGTVVAEGFAQCLDAIEGHVGIAAEGVVAVVDQETGWARGDPGDTSLRWSAGFKDLEVVLHGTSFPANGRSVNAGGEMVTLAAGQSQEETPALLSIVAHEFGHTIWFPHSYRFDPADYDNPMDIMSHAEAASGLQIGTIAINRYAAGWINPDEVEIYPGTGTARYSLGAPGAGGTQMLVLRAEEGGFMTLGARVKEGYDSGLPTEGVESYFIDVETSHCGGSNQGPCFGLSRPTRAVVPNATVPLDYHDTTAHVLGVNDGYSFGAITVTVVERSGNGFVVEVTDQPVEGEYPSEAPVNTQTLPGFYVEAYRDDPLNLIASYDVTTTYTLDDDLWEVWVCKDPNGYLNISPQKAVQQLQATVAPYFEQLSGGRYRPVFQVGGSVDTSPDEWSEYGNCEALVGDIIRKRGVGARPEGVLLLADRATFESYGSIGGHSLTEFSVLALNGVTYPQNNRELHLWGTVVATPDIISHNKVPEWALPYLAEDRLQDIATVAHEMGHALAFPHSLRFSDYDNPMDIMSRVDDNRSLGVGTIAINRYAAGWIDPSEVAIYGGIGVNRYRLSPPGEGGTQMLIIRSEGSGFLALGPRVRKGIDHLIPEEGVEVYLVDEQSPACDHFFTCTWEDRPTNAVITNPTVPLDFNDRFAHVLNVGDSFTTWNEISVRVVERIGDDFVVEVSQGATPAGPETRFSDVAGNAHEQNIEIIAQRGITAGCGVKLYCPSQPVTRAQMAAFLIRALGETAATTVTTSRFSDVPSGAWYLGYIERAADLGIVQLESDAAFRPDDDLKRLEMAVWLTRAFDQIQAVTPQGTFVDVPVDAWYADAAEGLLAAGITKGCSATPPTYCPDEPVRRDQMASFLARAVALSE